MNDAKPIPTIIKRYVGDPSTDPHNGLKRSLKQLAVVARDLRERQGAFLFETQGLEAHFSAGEVLEITFCLKKKMKNDRYIVLPDFQTSCLQSAVDYQILNRSESAFTMRVISCNPVETNIAIIILVIGHDADDLPSISDE